MVHKKKGFTLLELVIVVAVLAIVIAIALPILRNARKPANESAAVSHLRTICSAMEQYRLRFGRYPMIWSDLKGRGFLNGFEGDISPLYTGAPNAAGKSGYTFLISSFPGIPWRVFAVPNEPGESGDRYFYVDASGAVRESNTSTVGPSSPPVDG